MNIYNMLIDNNREDLKSNRIYGAVIGLVTNNKDPESLGRVKVRFPWLNNQNESAWARLAVLMAGADRGTYFLPEVNDEVLVIFEQGDMRFPYIIGTLWNTVDKPPFSNDDGKNDIRVIKSRSGHLIRLDDTEQSEKIEIIDKTGNNKIVFDTAHNAITITSDQDINLSAQKGMIKLEAQTIKIKSSGETQVTASQMKAEASGEMNIKGAVINLN